MNTVTKFPIDYESLEKGDVISIAKIEHITGKKYPTQEYDLAALQLRHEIEREMEDIGYPVVTRQKQGNILILKDNEAAEYTHNGFIQKLKGMGRFLDKQLQVDTNNLSSKEKKRHLRKCRKDSLTLQGAKMGRRGKLPSLGKGKNHKKLPDGF